MNNRLKIICLIVFVVGIVALMPSDGEIAVDMSHKTDAEVVVIDPGHGGMDGGASSSSGTSEKDINLSIGLKLKKLLENEGVKVIMTREEDRALYDEGNEGSIRSHKTEDMKVRKGIIDEANADLAISIHLNSFTQDSDVKGAQVFYPQVSGDENADRSSVAAEIIQKELNETINTAKDRTELGKNDVYILKNITCPIVIVECGFLSNPQEADMLNKNSYQGKIANTLKAGICSYLRGDNK